MSGLLVDGSQLFLERLYLFGQFGHLFAQLGQLFDGSLNAVALKTGIGRGPEDRDAGLEDVVRDTGLGTDFDTVGNGDVSDDSDLSAHHHVASDFGRPGDADLGGHDGIFADHDVVGNLDQVVEFGPLTDPRGPHGGTVDGTVGADFDVVFDHNIADLGNLLERSVLGGGEAETVAADHGPAMDGDVVADHTLFVDLHPGKEFHALADAHAITDIDLRPDFGSVADGGAFADHGIFANIDVLPDGCRRMDRSEGADADISVLDYDRKIAYATVVDGKVIMKDGELLGKGTTIICDERGEAYLKDRGIRAYVKQPLVAETIKNRLIP